MQLTLGRHRSRLVRSLVLLGLVWTPLWLVASRQAEATDEGSGLSSLEGEDWMNCYAVVAGKDCTLDGSVIYAHNEDSGKDRAVNHWKIPRIEREADAVQTLVNGGEVSAPDVTQSFLWCQMPGLQYSDSYLNESGVAVGSNGCPSREDKPDLTDGGIGLMLRRMVAERATSAREGVLVAGELLSTFGYADTGRTMVIADGQEAWLLDIVNGKNWVAARVPDDRCAVIANHYTIHHVDPEDEANFILSPGLIEYAMERGWYEPERDGRFDFATVFGRDGARKHRSNIRRAWRGNSLVSGTTTTEEWFQPTFIKPSKKLSPTILMEILRDHYEGTEYDISEDYEKCSPYEMGQPTICGGGTSFSTVFQLRGDLPPAIGSVMWIAMCRPDASVYVPWYAGITQVPEGFAHGQALDALGKHFDASFLALGYPPRFAAVRSLEISMEASYGDVHQRLDLSRDKLEASMLAAQAQTDASALKLHKQDPAAALEFLTSYTAAQQARANQLIDELRTPTR